MNAFGIEHVSKAEGRRPTKDEARSAAAVGLGAGAVVAGRRSVKASRRRYQHQGALGVHSRMAEHTSGLQRTGHEYLADHHSAAGVRYASRARTGRLMALGLGVGALAAAPAPKDAVHKAFTEKQKDHAAVGAYGAGGATAVGAGLYSMHHGNKALNHRVGAITYRNQAVRLRNEGHGDASVVHDVKALGHTRRAARAARRSKIGLGVSVAGLGAQAATSGRANRVLDRSSVEKALQIEQAGVRALRAKRTWRGGHRITDAKPPNRGRLKLVAAGAVGAGGVGALNEGERQYMNRRHGTTVSPSSPNLHPVRTKREYRAAVGKCNGFGIEHVSKAGVGELAEAAGAIVRSPGRAARGFGQGLGGGSFGQGAGGTAGDLGHLLGTKTAGAQRATGRFVATNKKPLAIGAGVGSVGAVGAYGASVGQNKANRMQRPGGW